LSILSILKSCLKTRDSQSPAYTILILFYTLLANSRKFLSENKDFQNSKIGTAVFPNGAAFMWSVLNKIRNTDSNFDVTKAYSFYGFLKYAISLFAFLIAVLWSLKTTIFLLPLSVFVFYTIEIHFLFLFPLLLDAVPNPICESIKMTYKIGFLKCLFTVLPIGVFMVIGLLNFKRPLYHWYIGCVSVLIWYQNELTNRV
jgi:hypothetical protein